MPTASRASRTSHFSAEALEMLAAGESGRFEFKSEVKSVTPKLLAALANWVALDLDRQVAHLLVGVEELEDKTTGLVYGKPSGLVNGLDRTVSRIQDVASQTRPIPVEVFIIEEGVAEAIPFVRVEIRPTMPPHFDDEGRRQTRLGRSTRALTDDELLRIYLDREAGSFAARFRQTTHDLQTAVGAVGTQVDQIVDAIDQNIAKPIKRLIATSNQAAGAASSAEEAASSAESAAMSAESAADLLSYDVQKVERTVRDVREVVDALEQNALESLAAQVVGQRRSVWWKFTVDTWERGSDRSVSLASALHDLLSTDISIHDAHNVWELRVWKDVLKDRKNQRGEKGTLKWWDEVVQQVGEYVKSPVYLSPDLPDMRMELQADVDKTLADPESLTNQFRDLLRD
jgi:hypothetical protein